MIKELKEKYKFDKWTITGIISLIIIISGLFGWIYEVIFYYFNGGMKVIYNRGSNFLPWINIYFWGSILICFLAYKHNKRPFKVFLISLIACGLLELLSGWFLYDILKMTPRAWSYNEEILNFGNIGGHICLRSVLFFGLSGLILIYLIIPLCIKLAKKIPRKIFVIGSISVCAIFLIDEIYNFALCRLFHLPTAKNIYKKLGIKYISFKR